MDQSGSRSFRETLPARNRRCGVFHVQIYGAQLSGNSRTVAAMTAPAGDLTEMTGKCAEHIREKRWMALVRGSLMALS
jgi:hypothetical protein